jgi:hypothetical protein
MTHDESTHNTHGDPGADEEADTASGGAPDDSGSPDLPDTTDDKGMPVDNPSGG